MTKKGLKPPKFIIGENPMIENSGLYITHMREPLIVAEVHEHDNEKQQSSFHDQIIAYQEKTKDSVLVGRGKYKDIPFTLLFTGKVIGKQKTMDDLAHIMRRMADWYTAYLKWEDAQ